MFESVTGVWGIYFLETSQVLELKQYILRAVCLYVLYVNPFSRISRKLTFRLHGQSIVLYPHPPNCDSVLHSMWLGTVDLDV